VLLALAACLLGAPPRALVADDEPEVPAPAEEVPQRTIAFADGMEAGRKQASEQQRLLFVYVGRHSPT
jgi:hypothetical protein